MYVFANEVLIYDVATLKQVDSWNFSLPNEPGLGRFRVDASDEGTEEPNFFSALFTVDDPVQRRPLLGVGRVDLAKKNIDFFPLGPAPDHGGTTFALAPDGQRGYVLREEIGKYEFWTIDMPGRRLQSKLEVNGRPRMAMKASSNGKLLYIYEAGNTIDLYQADGFKYLRTISLDADMMYSTFHVLPPRPQPRSSSVHP
jgi:hypothetical protein